MSIGEAKEMIKQIADNCNHHIPYYAYGENGAACEMSNLLSQTQDQLMSLISETWETKE